MILILTPNPALDVTYYLDHMTVGEANRVQEVRVLPGGKGLNVARVLHSVFGMTSRVGGFLGGSSGERLAQLLGEIAPELEQSFTPISGLTRSTVAVVDDRGATVLNEAGPQVSAADWECLITQLDALSAGDVLTVSGSLPPGSPATAYRELLQAAHSLGVATVVDTSGPALITAAEAGAWVLKPNHHELAEAVGGGDIAAGARKLLTAGARAVVVSRGEDGLMLFLEGQPPVQVRPPRVVSGNPTGAGDSVVAALTSAVARAARAARGEETAIAPQLQRELTEVLPAAVAVSAAAVLAPGAGEVDLPAYQQMLEELSASPAAAHPTTNRTQEGN